MPNIILTSYFMLGAAKTLQFLYVMGIILGIIFTILIWVVLVRLAEYLKHLNNHWRDEESYTVSKAELVRKQSDYIDDITQELEKIVAILEAKSGIKLEDYNVAENPSNPQ
ncbi:hypothetical protein [Ruminococcus sp.]|jgi:uncharacterized membrane protein|uniref:hypothetical protein n=1 Tax=Ruminococcus sp. TaxID=41978 RepID=UPI0025F17B8D|nr:hypothetical protein [Ruminococcus sp.]